MGILFDVGLLKKGTFRRGLQKVGLQEVGFKKMGLQKVGILFRGGALGEWESVLIGVSENNGELYTSLLFINML